MPRRDQFPAIFAQLKTILHEYVLPPLVVSTDTADNYALATAAQPKYPQGFFVAAVQVRKNYVSYHLMPVYLFPDLLEGLSERLKRRMQGKSCFNFTLIDEELFAELASLTAAGVKRFREQ
jgi:hypothetical protein